MMATAARLPALLLPLLSLLGRAAEGGGKIEHFVVLPMENRL